MTVQQRELFDAPAAHARRTHPGTSHAAAREITRSGKLTEQQRAALALVRAYPGLTATQLARVDLAGTNALGADPVSRRFALARRLPEIGPPCEKRPKACGLVRPGAATGQKGRKERRWFPA